jgi:hypothetical protein
MWKTMSNEQRTGNKEQRARKEVFCALLIVPCSLITRSKERDNAMNRSACAPCPAFCLLLASLGTLPAVSGFGQDRSTAGLAGTFKPPDGESCNLMRIHFMAGYKFGFFDRKRQ